MNISRYLFQSPYSSQVQIGRPDPSVKKEDSTQSTGAELSKNTNLTQQKAEQFKATQVSEVKPTVDSKQLLDTYA